MTKNRTRFAAFALSIVALAAGGFTVQSAAAAEKGKVTPALAKPLKEIQDLLKARKYQDAIAKLQAARQLPGRAPYDNYVINTLAYEAYAATKDYDDAAKAIAETVDSGFLDAAEQTRLTKSLMEIYNQQRAFDKVIEYGNRLLKAGTADETADVLIGQAYFQKGDFRAAQKFWGGLIEEQEKAGRVPKETAIEYLLNSCLKTKDESCVQRSYERLVMHYPKGDSWKALLLSLLNTSPEKDRLDVYRLMSDVGILNRGEDFTEMAELAMDAGAYGDAQKALDQAFARNAFSTPREKDKNQRLLQAAKTRGDADKATLAQRESQAKTGDDLARLGGAYLSYDMYDKAASTLQRALSTPGLSNRDEAQLLLGIADLRLKRKDDAIKAFKGATADPTLARVGNLWVLRAQS